MMVVVKIAVMGTDKGVEMILVEMAMIIVDEVLVTVIKI